MSRYLMAISLGPVQGFIAAARRTRDFWMGSTILSECAKAVAREVIVQEKGSPDPPAFGQLIFPAVESSEVDEYLSPIDFDADDSQLHNKFDVSNVVMAVLSGGESQMRAFATHLEGVAQGRWRDIARQAVEYCRAYLHDDWEVQVEERLIEFYSAWAPLSADEEYGDTRKLVARLLAGRKACRDFEWWEGRQGIPKSSLDGARETVLLPPKANQKRRRLRVKRNEQLDLIGVAKRVDWGHDAIRYPSVSRVAIEPFVASVTLRQTEDAEVQRLFDATKHSCERLKSLGALRQRRERNRKNIENDFGKFPWLKLFPYEGSPLYVSRHQEIVQELMDEATLLEGDGDVDAAEVVKELDQLRRTVEELQRACGIRKPWEYAAFMVADGDGMGATLSELAKRSDGVERHREFSRSQSMFAIAARELINRKFGACFYSGADDVLAMVSVHQAIPCACELHDLFHNHVGQFVAELQIPAPTLSVGVAIGHFMEPLEDLLDYARAAEYRAKNPTPDDQGRGQTARNGLALAVHARGGVAFTVRGHWVRGRDSSSGLSFDKHINAWAELHRRRLLSSKAAYDLREAARQYERPWSKADQLAQALQSDAQRILGRKQGENVLDRSRLKQLVKELLQSVRTPNDLTALAHELIVGQWIGDSMDQADGRVVDSGMAGTEAIQ